MPTVPAFMLTATVTVEAYQGETGQGGPSFGDPVTVRAHVEPAPRLVIHREGREVRGEMKMITAPTETIPPESRVTYGGRTYRAITSAQIPSPGGGVHHLEIALG